MSGVTETSDTELKISVNGTELTATLAENFSAGALTELLNQGKITVDMSDCGGVENVGDLPQSLPAKARASLPPFRASSSRFPSRKARR